MLLLENNHGKCLSTVLQVWAGRDEQVFRLGSGRGFSQLDLEESQMESRRVSQRGVPWDRLGRIQEPPKQGLEGEVPGRCSSGVCDPQTWSFWWTSDSQGNHCGGDVRSDREHLLGTSAFWTRICLRPCTSAPEHLLRVQRVLVTLIKPWFVSSILQ